MLPVPAALGVKPPGEVSFPKHLHQLLMLSLQELDSESGQLAGGVGQGQGPPKAISLCKLLQRNQGHDPPLNLPSNWEGQMYPRDLMRLCHEVWAGAGTEGSRTESREAKRRNGEGWSSGSRANTRPAF